MMRNAVAIAASLSGLAAAHGHVKEYIVDGVTYPSFDPTHDYDPKWGAKRIEWGFSNGKSRGGVAGGVAPVETVVKPEINCRFGPLKEPAIQAVARAGANITFQWLDYFINHMGPVLTYMGELPASGNVDDTKYFKIHEDTYEPATQTWGSQRMVRAGNRQTVTIPSDIKPGTYVVRHEAISLHNALNDDFEKKSSGAQFYPQCIKVKVTGDGTATPPGEKFPGTYKWDDKGLLFNLYFHPNEYFPPGGPVYKPANPSPPKGPAPTADPGSVMSPDVAAAYKKARAATDAAWVKGVAADVAKHPGGNGCIWEPGQDVKTAKCSPTNPQDPKYKGLGQPPTSPMYVDENSSNRKNIGRGPIIKYLFDPTQPRWEERVKAAGKTTRTLRLFRA